jgi:hypothetical protein
MNPSSNPPPGSFASNPPVTPELDPIKVQAFQETLREEQSLPRGVVAGGVAAGLGAIIWAIVAYLTNYQIGWMAIGVGFLVGWAMRLFGKGIDKIFGLVGAALSLAGCVAGNLLMLGAVIAREESASLIEVITFMILNPAVDVELLVNTFSPIDLLFYGLALYYGYKASFRQITPAEQASLYRTPPTPPIA